LSAEHHQGPDRLLTYPLLLFEMSKPPNVKVSVLLACAVCFNLFLLYKYLQQAELLAELTSSRSRSTTTTTTHASSALDGTMSAALQSSDWNPVYIYRGGPPPVQKRPWTGQVQQDKLIWWLTKNMTNGYFIDLAANKYMHLSNTFSLERNLHWNGLCIEANPEYWHDLGRFRSCTVVGAVIGGQADEKILFAMRGVMGGIAGESFDNKKLRSTEERYTAQLEKTFETFNVPKVIDYFSLDVEGAEEYIMDAFPLERYRFRFLTVERPSANLTQKLADHGYRLVKKLVYFGDTLFAHESEMPIDMSLVDKYCKDSGGKYCTDKKKE